MVGGLSITDMYMSVLSSLSVDEKLDLISRLSDSIRDLRKKESATEADPFACYKGDWGGELSPSEEAERLRSARTFTRNVEPW